ncbi:hypothetical protein SBD_5906 [Streptomyces bottropensis ATCC 25435]|uniref:Uncharacterized protein n=1 Tax=Streptomyces bottropensis ATCC 25435 TaxID=1054862 RepID=M3D985_9ACTN|nr:hypothetical protein SBD_5906 [Streptomyces bottropensis ATCC 25435]
MCHSSTPTLPWFASRRDTEKGAGVRRGAVRATRGGAVRATRGAVRAGTGSDWYGAVRCALVGFVAMHVYVNIH